MSNMDFAILQRGVVGKGDGSDTYVISNNLVQDNAKITLSDSGLNTLHLIDGLEIASSKVAANALLLTLSNGAEITVLDAANYEFVVGGDPITGETGTSYDLQGLASNILGVEVPSSGIASGGNTTLGQAPSSSTDIVIDSTMDTLVVQRGITGKGSGHDTYILSNDWIEAGSEITITDTGSNTIQFIDGLEVASSMVAPNALMFTLSNGATVTVLDADDYTFEVGGNTIQNEKGNSYIFTEFVTNVLNTHAPTDNNISISETFNFPIQLDQKKFFKSDNDSIVSINYFGDGSERWAVRNFFVSNIDNIGGQELIIAGAETQPNTPEEYSNTYLSVLSIIGGKLVNITKEIIADDGWKVIGVADIAFGDFNGDGKQDFFSAAGTDMDMEVPVYAFYSSSSGFIREEVEKSNFHHGSFSFDINNDGYDDVIAVGYKFGTSVYFGSSEGLLKYESDGLGGASGVALGDFLGNGSIQAVFVDTAVGHDIKSDTTLFQLQVDEDRSFVQFSQISTLPLPRLEADAFSEILKNVQHKVSHDIRAETIDFNNDGLLDVVVFSRSGYDPVGGWLDVSQIQFLKNLGNAQFEDVTEKLMAVYDFNSQVSYEPIFADFNGDGYTDIFSSYASFSEKHNSSVFLLGTEDGTFTEWGRTDLGEIISPVGGMAQVVADEHGEYWLVVGHQSIGYEGREEILSLYSISFT